MLTVQKDQIISRIITAVEMCEYEENCTPENRNRARESAMLAIESTPVKEAQFFNQMDAETWESVLGGNTGFGEWASRTANFAFNAYH